MLPAVEKLACFMEDFQRRHIRTAAQKKSPA